MLRILIHCSFLIPAAASCLCAGEADLAGWGEELERIAGRIVFVPVSMRAEPGEVKLPANLQRKDIIARYLRDPYFQRELAAAHALTVNWEGGAERYHFIVLNMDLAGQWESAREGLIAHELGHIWLHAKGLASPAFEPGPGACLDIQSTDIVQHELIRGEMKRRGISGKEYLLNNLKISLGTLSAGNIRSLTRCQRVVMLSHWLDFRHGLVPGDWEEAERYRALHEESYPDISATAAEIEEYLREHEIEDRESFLKAVAFVRERL